LLAVFSVLVREESYSQASHGQRLE
jgi:hypothetical protein